MENRKTTLPTGQEGDPSITLPDDVLIDAARMFYPEVAGLDTFTICAAAMKKLRERICVDGIPDSAALARWRASDPVSIAYHAMIFVPPKLASDRAYHPWFDRLLKLQKEREERFKRNAVSACRF